MIKIDPQDLPQLPGVYMFRDLMGKILYIGKAKNLRNRVSSYFENQATLGPKTQKLTNLASQITHIKTENELEALILEADLIRRYKPPFNIQWKDDKSYKFIKINLPKTPNHPNIWPTVGTSRRHDLSKALAKGASSALAKGASSALAKGASSALAKGASSAYFFGPFPEGKTVNQVLKTVRKIFPWCKYTRPPRDKKPCFYYHLGLCPGICARTITIKDYSKIIGDLVKFLQGKKRTIVKKWRKEMFAFSKVQNFELAAKIRNRLKELDYILQKFHSVDDFLQNPNLLEDQAALEISEIAKLLKLPRLRNFRIEAYDISNLSGQEATGSMVVFTNGLKDPSEFRRFKIKTLKTANDPGMMAEIIKRRFNNNWPMPDLILIDGGPGQLSAVLQNIPNLPNRPKIIALAKKLEEIYLPLENSSFQKLILPKDSPALNLLRRVRDEAHRFSLDYHHKLRQKLFLTKIKGGK